MQLLLLCYWCNIRYYSSCHLFVHADTFLNAKNINLWRKSSSSWLTRSTCKTVAIPYLRMTTNYTLSRQALLSCQLRQVYWIIYRMAIISFTFTHVSLARHELSKVLRFYQITARHFLTIHDILHNVLLSSALIQLYCGGTWLRQLQICDRGDLILVLDIE